MRPIQAPAPPRLRTRTPAWVSMVLLALLPSAALAAPPAEELLELQKRLADAERRAVMAEVEVERLRQRVLELEAGAPASRPSADTHTSAHSGAPIAPSQPDSVQPIDDGIAWSAPTTTGSVVEEDLLDEELLEEDRLAEEIASEETASNTELGTVPETTPPPPPTVPTDAVALDLYDRGYALFHQEHYREAEALFEDYIAAHAQTELADNALFWIGECRYARGDYEAALEAFTNTVVRFPEGNKVPDALLKAGKSLEALGQLTEARATYQELTANFPGSLATLAAEERLTALAAAN